jgi:iron(III) transport system ATP-binding protein
LDLDGVSVSYGESGPRVLDGLSMNVQPGEFVSILGRSGAGKTTLLRVLAGFERVSSGYVRVGGRLVGSSFVHVPPERRRIGLVFQDYALFPHLTVRENVAFGLKGEGRERRSTRVTEMVALVGLAGMEDRYAHELSGGQQQRVALARALAPQPLGILMDEPFSNLDRELRSSLRREVRRIVKAAGVTALLVTHDREEALALADKVAVMGQGRIEQYGAPEDVYAAPVSPEVARMVGPAELIDGVLENGYVRTEAGSFPATTKGSVANGSTVRALMRASELEISPAGSDSHVARVLFREFRGEFTEYGVELPSGVVVRVRRRSAGALGEGDLVTMKERQGSKIIVYPAR